MNVHAHSAMPPRAHFLARAETWIATHPRATCAVLYAIALVLRLVYLAGFRHSRIAEVPLMDEAFYRNEAQLLARGAPAASDAYFMTPLYPWFLSLVFRVAGDDPVAPFAVQLVLGALVAPLAFGIARRAVRPGLAAFAGLGAASFAPLVFFEALFLVEGLVLLALASASWLALRAPRSKWHATATGALLGVAVLGRGSNLLLVVPFAAWFALHAGPARRGARRGALRRTALFAAGLALVLAPLVARNAARTGRPFLLTTNAGFNLYVGNGPEANGIFVRLPRLDLAQDPLTLRYVERAVHRPVGAVEASDYWMARTRDWVRAHPGRTFALYVWKLVLFWNRLSIPQVEGFEGAAAGTALARPPFGRSFAVLPLALVGLGCACIGAWRARRGGPIAARLFVAACTWTYATSIAVFFVTDRYRVPALAWIFVLAAVALQVAIESFRRDRRPLLAGLGIAAAAAWVITDPDVLRVDRRRMDRDLHVHAALRAAGARDFDAALAHYGNARALDPGSAEIHDGYARMLARAGRDTLAMREFEALLAVHPDDDAAWYNYGNVLRRAGRLDAALAAYRRSLVLQPEREAAWNNAGEVFRVLGDTARAAEAYRRALEVVPSYDRALNNLAALRGAQGDGAAAERGFRAAAAANPRYLPALVNLAILLGDTGRAAEARATWERVRSLDPGNAAAARALGVAPEAAPRRTTGSEDE